MDTPSNPPEPHPRPINLISEGSDIAFGIIDMLLRAPFDAREQPKPMADGLRLYKGTSSAGRVDAFDFARRQVPPEARKRESQNGSPPIAEDYRAHDLAAARFRALGFYHGSEEGSDEEWDEFEDAPVGAWCVITDPLDGSGPYKHTWSNFSVNALIYKKTVAGVELRMSIVVTSSHSVLVWTADGRVSFAPGTVSGRPDLRDLAEFRQHDDPGSIAVAAAKPSTRKRIMPVLCDEELTVYTVGGAPASVGMVAGSLSMILYPSPQTLHDAAGLPALIQLGATLIGAGGKILNPMEILALFDNPARPGAKDDPDHKRIPPMVIVVEEQQAEEEQGKSSSKGVALAHAMRVARSVLGKKKSGSERDS